MSIDTPPLISPSIRKMIVFTALVGYAILFLYLFFFVGTSELMSAIGRINVSIFALAIASIIISLTFHTLVWFQLLRALSFKLSFRRTYILYWVGVFVDNLVPGGWSGDLFKAYLLNKDPTVESGKAVASVVAKNMYETIFNLGNMIFGIILLLLNYTFEGYLLITLGGIMLLSTLPLAILIAAGFKPKGAKKIIAALFRFLASIGRNRWNFSWLQAKVNKAFDDYREGMKILLQNRKVLFKPMLPSFFAWSFEIIALIFVFAALGLLIPPDKVIIVHAIAGQVEVNGVLFAGYSQIITSELYRALGVPFITGASMAVLSGTGLFWLKTGISYTAFHYTIFSRRSTFIGNINSNGVSREADESDDQKGISEQASES
jgi:uncharacterized protein (TIRG00374 family)